MKKPKKVCDFLYNFALKFKKHIGCITPPTH